jgi:uncharacterized protein YyaL (SSP411 family)
MNRLARERSPYLLQHAGNPVDWFPWGDEAFARARSENKPIFLSIGYSTCHWCHVMERESFENEEIAALLNREFVSIKVDREERPDVDRVYMTFVQATTGSGGWPMSVWLTPELKPFYGGTYFPPTSKWGRPGFLDIVREIARVWNQDREKVAQSAEAVIRELHALDRTVPVWTVPGADALNATVSQFKQTFDSRRGGFGDAPKFPRPSELLFLLREYARTGDRSARDMVLHTLRAMALGGMRDHIGGGFHRYSVDAEWRVPHFEKMLYDQAQLALACIEAAQASGDPFYAEVAEDTLLYVLREMTDAAGGFYSAEDADSVPPESAGEEPAERKEGAFYLWRQDELEALLGDDAAVVKLRFGIEPDGNAPHDPQQEFTGKNLLYVARSIDEIARTTGLPNDRVVDILHRARVRMFEARLRRPRPHRDDKVLTAWNGLMIAALARMARLLAASGEAGEAAAARFRGAAVRAASFIRERMWSADRRVLLRRYRDGHAEIAGYAEDYAYLIFGLLELFQTESQPMWLEWALALQHRQDELFGDDEAGGWFSTDGRDPSVLLRMKEDYDGAEPAPSSVSVLNLLMLSHLVEDAAWLERVERTLKLFGARLERAGRAVPMMAAALSTYVAGVQQIVVVHGSKERAAGLRNETEAASSQEREPLSQTIARQYLPFAVVLEVTPERRQALAASLPLVAAMQPLDGRTAVYVCRDFACRQPVTSADALQQELGTIA